jgi:hypothetical protein
MREPVPKCFLCGGKGEHPGGSKSKDYLCSECRDLKRCIYCGIVRRDNENLGFDFHQCNSKFCKNRRSTTNWKPGSLNLLPGFPIGLVHDVEELKKRSREELLTLGRMYGIPNAAGKKKKLLALSIHSLTLKVEIPQRRYRKKKTSR